MAKSLALYSEIVTDNNGREIIIYNVITAKISLVTYGKSEILGLQQSNKIVNIDNKGNIRKQWKRNQIIVFNEAMNGDFIALDLENKKWLSLSTRDILKEPDKYFNIAINRNKIKILNKLCNSFYDSNTAEKFNKAIEFDTRQKVIGTKIFNLTLTTDGNVELIKSNLRNTTNYDNKVLVIPDFVDIIGKGIFYSNAYIEKLVIGENVKIIADEAFYNCYNLKEIVFNNKLQEIRNNTFFNCKNLIKIEFNEQLKIIGDHAFTGCIRLEEVKFNKELKEIQFSAFLDCYNLKEIDIEHTDIKSIDLDSIYNDNLTILRLPENLKTIDMDSDFFDITFLHKLSEVKLPINYKQLELVIERLNFKMKLHKPTKESTLLNNMTDTHKRNIQTFILWSKQNKRTINIIKTHKN